MIAEKSVVPITEALKMEAKGEKPEPPKKAKYRFKKIRFPAQADRGAGQELKFRVPPQNNKQRGQALYGVFETDDDAIGKELAKLVKEGKSYIVQI